MTDSTSKPPRKRMQWSAAEKAAWVDLYRNSGQSIGTFCLDNDLAKATLTAWLRVPPPSAGEENELIEVPRQVVAELASTPKQRAVTMQLPGGARLKIAPGTDPAWLAQLARAFAPVRS